MKTRWLALTLLLASGVTAAVSAAPELTNETVVAQVEEQPIRRGELRTHLLRYFGVAAREGLMDRAVIRQEATRLKVQVTDKDIDARAEEAKRAASGSLDDTLTKAGIDTETWREQLRYNLLAEKVLARKWPIRPDDLTRLSVRYARLQTDRVAKDLIREAKLTPFETLVLRDSEDKENGGQILPEKFLRVERPNWYKYATDANIRVGQVTPKPLEVSGFWVVLKLEGKFGPETLKPNERTAAIQKINTFRMSRLMPTLRRQYRVDKSAVKASIPELTKDLNAPDSTVVAQVGTEAINLGMLRRHLMRYFGKAALEQRIERQVVSQEAERLKVTVSEPQIEARIAAAKKQLGKLFQQTLDQDGITEEAWRERVRFTYLAERVANTRNPAPDDELVRFTARFISVPNEQSANNLLDAVSSGAAFQVVSQRAAGAGASVGQVQPKEFLRADNPTIYKALADGDLNAGETLPKPIKVGRSWLILRLEAKLGPETLTPGQREDATARINAPKGAELLDAVRKDYKVNYSVPISALVAAEGGGEAAPAK